MRILKLVLALFIIALLTFAIVQQYKNYFGKKEPKLKVLQSFGNYLAASVAQKTGDYESAISNLETALLKDQDNVKLIKKLYGFYLFTGNYEKALEQAKRNIELNKINNTNLAKISAVPYILVALEEFKNGDTKKIPDLLSPLTDPSIPDKTHIDGVVLPLVLAWAYASNDNFSDAFSVIDNITADYMLSVFSYNRALINDLANNKQLKIENLENKETKYIALHFIGEIFFEIAQFAMQNGQLEEAATYTRIARYIDSENYKYTKLLGVIFESLGRYSDAIAIYDEVHEDNEGYTDSLLAKAIALSRAKKNEDALELLEDVSDDKKLRYQAKFTAGSILLSDENYNNAIEKLEEAIKTIKKPKKDDWAVYFNLGVAYDKNNNWQLAEKNLIKSVELFPENPESLNYLAYSWLVRNKNIPQAQKMLESAVIRSGGAAHILDSYGWALFKLGKYDQSLPFLEQAAIAIPYNSVINDHLADLYWKIGRKREAKYLWQRALDNFNKETSLETNEIELKKKISQGI